MRAAPLLLLAILLPLRAQPPAAAPAMAQEVDPGPSQLAFPIRIDLEPLVQEMERVAPKIPPGVEQWVPLAEAPQGSCYRFWLQREPLSFALHGSHLSVRVPARYWLEVGMRMVGGWYQRVAGCGQGPEGLRGIILGLQAEMDLQPDWAIRLYAQVDRPLAVAPCRITFLEVDITDKVVAGMQAELTRALQALARQIGEQAFLRPRAEAVWRSAQQPMELAPGIFLALNPERIRLAPLRSEGRTLVITPEILARPAIAFGAPPAPGSRPLPLLETGAPVDPAFRVRLDLDLPFAEATRQLRAQVLGRSFETEKGRFEIEDASVRGQEGKAVIEVAIKGKVEGRLALAGRPVFDPAKGSVRLEELDYTLESRSWMTRFGEWLFRSSLRRTLQEKSGWLLEKSLADLRGQIQQGLNRELLPGIALQGELRELRLGPPRILEDRFRIEASLEGKAEVAVRGVPGMRLMH